MKSLPILIRVRQIVRHLNLASKAIEKEFGLTLTQLICLYHIGKCPNQQTTQRELMQTLSLNSSTVTGILKRLMIKGFIYRVQSEEDRRISKIRLTSSGRHCLQGSPKVIFQKLDHKLQNLTEEEQMKIMLSLDQIITVLD